MNSTAMQLQSLLNRLRRISEEETGPPRAAGAVQAQAEAVEAEEAAAGAGVVVLRGILTAPVEEDRKAAISISRLKAEKGCQSQLRRHPFLLSSSLFGPA